MTQGGILLRGIAVASVLGLTLSACGDDGDGNGGDDGGGDGCEAYADYEGHDGTTVNIASPITAADSERLAESWAEFEDCTGITIAHNGTDEFEAQLRVNVQGGNPPDLAFTPQPGLIAELVEGGSVLPAPDAVETLANENWSEDWRSYTTIDGEFYGAPLGAFVKSYVWYSPADFEANGWAVPATWDELIALSDTIAGTGIKPWCAGIASGDATGWPATDWVEDLMLRTAGPDVYDQWYLHEIPFNDPQVVAAFDAVGQILKNENYVNGGIDGVESIATTAFEDAGLTILDGTCALHRQAQFYATNFPEGTNIAEDGDVFAFYLPPVDPAQGQPVLGSGEFVIAFTDRPEVQAVQTYLATTEWANSRAQLGGWASANLNADINNFENPIDRLSVELLQDPEAVFRFDASDLMPGEVGAGSFWAQITEWITGQSTQETVDNIENSWPS
jgi:alpha-glucoside transport system substrate-binding protein